ncbi:MAG: type IV toxin-antitoxin system AbiEi family antitoxin domain-containing protein [Myxococcaceae bacterium]
MSTRNGKPTAFDLFARSPVFTHEEFVLAHAAGTERSPHTANNILAHHLAAGHLVRVRRGLYATVPRGVNAAAAAIDPYLVATRLAADAVVAYHAALQFHGKAYSVSNRFTYLTHSRARPLRFRGAEFVPVQLPAALRALADAAGGVVEHRHAGGTARVATLERTLVDVLDAPEHGGGWEEIWRSLESVEFFDLDAVVAYALKLGSALTVARVGFFLEQHREPLMVEERHLEALGAHAPGQPRYLDQRREPGKLVSRWNLVVPEHVLSRAWAEVS